MANLQSGLLVDPFAANAAAQIAVDDAAAAAGIFTISQIAGILKTQELNIQRAIAKRNLKATNWPAGPTEPGKQTQYAQRILASDLQTFLKGGCFDLNGMRFENDWFADGPTFYAAQRFQETRLPDAASASVPSNAALQKFYAEEIKAGRIGPTQKKPLSFDLSNTAGVVGAMKEPTGNRYGDKGTEFLAQMLRNATRMRMKQTDELLRPGESPIVALYSSASRFEKITAAGWDFAYQNWNGFSLQKTIQFWPQEWGIATQQGGPGDWSNSQEERGQQLMRGFQPDPRPSATAPAPQFIQVSFSCSMATLLDRFAPKRGDLIDLAF
jgi:hypothetical protein